MTYTQFIAECTERTINPQLAAENEAVQKALHQGDDEKVLQLLDEEF